jgi:hypothetical protein
MESIISNTMNPTLKQLNKLVLAFLRDHADAANQDELWMDSDTQKQVKNLLFRASKPLRDPNAPKRGKSSYLYFCQENRSTVKKSLGDNSKATDVTRELGVRWNKLKSNKKKVKQLNKYKKLADVDKKRYQDEKAAYTTPKEFRTAVKSNGPKRARSAYLYFCVANRNLVKKELGEGSKATDVTRELGARWGVLKKDKGTEKFDKLAVKDKKRYQDEKSTASSSSSSVSEEDELVDEVSVEKSSKKAPKKKVKTLGSKKSSKKVSSKTGRNGYQVYCKEHRDQVKKDNPNVRSQEVTKKLSAAWKNLSSDEQDVYKQSAASA